MGQRIASNLPEPPKSVIFRADDNRQPPWLDGQRLKGNTSIAHRTTDQGKASRLEAPKDLTAIRDQGVTILLVEQDIHLALAAADRAYVLETGRIVREGPARDLIEDPELKRAYLGV